MLQLIRIQKIFNKIKINKIVSIRKALTKILVKEVKVSNKLMQKVRITIWISITKIRIEIKVSVKTILFISNLMNKKINY